MMDGQQPSFPSRSFDVITGSMSVHMLPDPASDFRAYHRLLHPTGAWGWRCPRASRSPSRRSSACVPSVGVRTAGCAQAGTREGARVAGGRRRQSQLIGVSFPRPVGMIGRLFRLCICRSSVTPGSRSSA
ncbi:methyltransferase domain-containing protein [Kitasatospora sp. NPDC058444]|uniref:methyltransferase domain-containing protein n=1 Tax=Kitasatospora sp. NPDC058444 TaxID=3346504 RepID=UPI003650656D